MCTIFFFNFNFLILLLSLRHGEVSLTLILVFCPQIQKLTPIWKEFTDFVQNCLDLIQLFNGIENFLEQFLS